MTSAFIALGANLGDPVAQLREAAQRLRNTAGLHSVQLSPIYFSAPVGVVDQPRFANAAVRLETSLDAHELLAVCHSVERAMGRVRTVRWGPRTIDLDLIFFGTIHLSDDALTLPHPRWSERAFVVQPIYDLAHDLVIDGISLRDTLARLDRTDLQRAG